MRKFVIAALVLLLFTGCFKKEPPKCSDNDTIVTVQDIFAQNIEKVMQPFYALMQTKVKKMDLNLPHKIVTIKDARPQSYDEHVKRRVCKATAKFDNGLSAQITYSVQLDEQDSSKFYVELQSDFMEPLLQESIMQSFLQQKRD